VGYCPPAHTLKFGEQLAVGRDDFRGHDSPRYGFIAQVAMQFIGLDAVGTTLQTAPARQAVPGIRQIQQGCYQSQIGHADRFLRLQAAGGSKDRALGVTGAACPAKLAVGVGLSLNHLPEMRIGFYDVHGHGIFLCRIAIAEKKVLDLQHKTKVPRRQYPGRALI